MKENKKSKNHGGGGLYTKIVILVVTLVLIIGISYAALTLSSQGVKENSITTGAITMNYTEENNSIGIGNAVPMADEEGKILQGTDQVFDFTVSMNITGNFKVAYEIVAVKDEPSTLENQDIKLYLERSHDATNYESVMEPTYYTPIQKKTNFGAPVGSMIMDTGIVSETTIYYYRLRMWVAAEYNNPQESKTFTVKVNVYGTTEEKTLDEEGPKCEFTNDQEFAIGKETKILLNCTDEITGVEKKELSKDILELSNPLIAEIKSISSPKKISNGYQYEIIILGKNADNFTLTLPKGIIKDKVNNTNNEVTKQLEVKEFIAHRVTYDYQTNGGSSASKITEEVNTNEKVDLTVTAEKNGWLFVGWNTTKDATTALTNITMPDEDITLYAIYKKEAVTLKALFNGNGATLDAEEKTCKLKEVYNNQIQEESCTVETPAITRKGYTIIGYNQNKQATEKEIGSKESLTLTLNNTNKTWYAITTLEMKGLEITLSEEKVIYDGTPKTPTVIVKHGDVTLIEGVDYTVEYENNTNVGTGIVKIIGSGKYNQQTQTSYSDKTTKNFTIEKATPIVTLSAERGTVKIAEEITFTESSSIAGTFTHTSSSTSIATVSPSNYSDVAANTNKEVTLTGVESGISTITITFTPTDTTNYKPVTKTYQVTVYGVATTGSCASRTYNGSSQTLASGGTGVTYSNNSRTNAGTQIVTVTANSGYQFSDGTTSKTLSCSIEKATPTVTLSATSGSVNASSTTTFTEKASVAGSFTNTSSNTSIATVSPSSYSSVTANTAKTVTITGVSNGTSTITVTFTPTDTTNYNTATKTYAVTGYKVATTGSCASRTYTGSSQTLASGGTGVTYTNNSRTTAGSQTVTVTASSGYRFSDGTTSKTLSCSIAKATPTVTLSATSGKAGKTTPVTFTEKASVAGSFTNTSSSTSIATVSPSSYSSVAASTAKTVTVTGVSNGSSTITVRFTPNDTTNYNTPSSKTYTVTSDFTLPVWSLSSATTSNGSTEATAIETITIKLNGTDTSGVTSSLTASNIQVLVGGTTVTPTTKTLSSATSITNGKQYTLTLSGINSLGGLNLIISSNTLTDGAGNKNTQTSISTGITFEKETEFSRAYTYNQTTGASNYCVTGDEVTCQATTCYKTKTAGSCPAGTIINYKVNDTETVRFHVMEDKGSTMTMQSQKNIVYNKIWASSNNSKGPLTVLPALESATSEWANVNNQTYTMGTTIFKGNSYTGCSAVYSGSTQTVSCNNGTNTYTLASRTAKTRMITVQELLSFGCDGVGNSALCPVWVFNYLSCSTDSGGTVNDKGSGFNNSYWTMTAYSSGSIPAFHMNCSNSIQANGVGSTNFGARAVVVVSK